MPDASDRVDAYIEKSPEYARPILNRIRQLFHKACPDIEETIKWSAPTFEHRGMVASMAAFKNYVRLVFWKGRLLTDRDGLLEAGNNTDMAAMKIANVDDLPSAKVMTAYIKEAVAVNVSGKKTPRPKRPPRAEVVVPDYFLAALKKNKKALAAFEGFSPSHRREYVEWITDAKREETRQKRIATAIEWLAQGKPRNWKYMK